jgi:outer membrane protein assembly factor BamE (lipoprotein component of BamABCDE complex)
MIIRSIICFFLVLLSSAGCGLIYKQNIQQGNALEQEELDELYIGMNQRQVLFVLGTPSIKDPFQPDRWDYVQTFSRRGGEIVGQSDPFAASGSQVGGLPATRSGSVATFVKKPDASPQDASLEQAEEEVLGKKDPDIDTVPDRSSDDRDYRKDQDVLDQTPRDGPLGPDIDG